MYKDLEVDNEVVKGMDIFDVIGFGAGPFNLSVAALASNTPMSTIFFEKKDSCQWHTGMQIDSAKIQNSHLRDLVSLADPTNKFSFTNFLHKTGRLEVHLIAGFSNILRKEFEQYMNWVTSELRNIKFSHEISTVCKREYGFEVFVKDNTDDQIYSYKTKSIVVGTGSQPMIPDFAQNSLNENVFHNSQYINRRAELTGKRVSIVGGGQSGLEVMLDMINSHTPPSEIILVDKQPFIAQIEDSQFAENVVFSTTGIEAVYGMEPEKRSIMSQHYKVTSDGASLDTIQALYQDIYSNELLNSRKLEIAILHNTSVVGIAKNQDQSMKLELCDQVSNESITHNTDVIVFATGYKQAFPSGLFSQEVLSCINFDSNGLPDVNSDYDINYNGVGNIFVVNGARHTHGVVDPNLSLNAIRAAKIINHNLGYEFYNINSHQIYKDFSLYSKSMNKRGFSQTSQSLG